MPVVSAQKLIALQRSPERIRNICILAHVDHGKTSLSDALLATNGIISPKLAGKIRYLDSRPDEQLRGITMESSAISLYFSMMRRKAAENGAAAGEVAPQMEEYLINLIDSPGHIDFQSEVSTASRLCDGAVVLIDAVEGVCSQTVTVLRQTWVEKLKPILVINKMDRLITELELTPAEAYIHLSKLLENVNVVMGSFFQGERMEEDLRWRERLEERANAAAAKAQEKESLNISDTASVTTDGQDYEEKDDEDIYFAPEKNNVVFSSAIDGWAFTVKQFAGIYEKKLGIKRSVLEKVLWGDFYLDPKTKRILGSKHLKGRHLKPIIVQLVLDNVWAVYQATTGGPNRKGDEALLTKILTSLNISIPTHILKSRNAQNILTTLFAKWLPLSTAVLVSVIEQLPSPPTAQAKRMPALLDSSPGATDISSEIRTATCDFTQADDQPVLAFVSKMVAVKESELPRNKRPAGRTLTAEEARELARKKRAEIAQAQSTDGAEPDLSNLTSALGATELDDTTSKPETQENEDPEHLIGFARLYSGTLKVGAEIYVIPPKYSASHPDKPAAIAVKVEGLYLLMGRALEALDSVPAGSIFGISGLENVLLKSGTLSSSPRGAPNLAGIASTQVSPIVRVALEPEHPADLDKMIAGLKLLERSDPCATYEQLESGEHILATAGELHLERCLKDLRERFARCEITSSEPIVPFREGIINAPSVSGEMAIGPRGTAEVDISKGVINIRLRVRPLPTEVMEFLISHTSCMKRVVAEQRGHEGHVEDSDSDSPDVVDVAGEKETGTEMSTAEFEKVLRETFASLKGDKEHWASIVDKIIAFGPRGVGPNLFLDTTGQLGKPIFSNNNPTAVSTVAISDKIRYAFQLATSQGPLCHEPTQGLAVSIESITTSATEPNDTNNMTRLTSEIIKSVRQSIHTAMLEFSPRLHLATYSCEISAPTESLGRVYPVLTRRHATILSETLHEASNVYTITSLLPLHESFGFSDEIRKRTSGGATAQMVFHGFEMLDEDPFWVPATEEEKEDLGDTADRENRAKALVDGIRGRKGLLVLGKGLDGEKGKNLKR
ncbi:ribosome biogenesis protein Ria1 [Microthyrium microscopicum]|uniref:Ribosome assembly protein 1 n=1 Tax=Microthyrium microscopicum TaxID=703497 RepID=A0A6A6ULP2_9PEZI|nr:ribosome biogenesis protein Ria1 [Microthyrium microscopicum]